MITRPDGPSDSFRPAELDSARISTPLPLVMSSTPAPVAAEVARMSLFLSSGAARHITGQTLHVSHGALTQFA